MNEKSENYKKKFNIDGIWLELPTQFITSSKIGCYKLIWVKSFTGLISKLLF
jgi:hypothetical protein